MRSRLIGFRLVGYCALLATAMAGGAAAQTVPFQILLTSSTSSGTVANDTQVAFDAEVGQTLTIQGKATYTGNGQVMITQPLQLLGSLEFTASVTGTLPITMFPGNSLPFSMTFKPTNSNQVSAQLTIPYTETVSNGTTATTNTSAIVLVLAGSSPAYQLSYFFTSNTSNENVIPLQSGGAIAFPPTQINTSAVAVLDISNIGSGAGTITAITQPTNPAFKVAGIPLITPTIPFTLAAQAQLPLQITYTPTATSSDTDQIQITLGSGTVLTVGLQGSGTNATYTYQLLTSATPATVKPPGPIALPDTNVGSTNSIIVQVLNSGNATGVITNPPSISGTGFSVTDNTIFPQTLKAGGSFTFTINFSPTQPGAQKGVLVVGTDLFNLTGNGLGSSFTFSYTSSAGTITLGNNPTVVFSPVQVTKSEQITFVVTNTGTVSTTVSNVGIVQSPSPFSVSGLPPLPVTVAAGKSFQFTVNYAPTTSGGFSSGTLQIDTAAINLTGSGTAPPGLPSFTIQGPTGNVTPLTQPTIGLTLASAYPVDLTGTLTLTVATDLAADPAVVFSTGGRSVPFVIPANTTSANFAGLGSQISLQTGTVASTITLTPTFTTAAGDINVTPSNPATLQFTVPAAAPVLIALTLSGQTANSFALQVSGYTTTRTLSTLNVTFTPASGFSLTSSTVPVDLSQVSLVWFQSTASDAFGGEFTVTVPFTLAGTIPTGDTLVQAISAISATISNSVGTSGSVQTNVQ